MFAAGPWLPRLFPDVVGSLITVTKQDVVYLGPAAGDERWSDTAIPCWVDMAHPFYGLPSAEGGGFKVAPDRFGPAWDPTDGDRLVDPDAVRVARAYAERRFPGIARQPVIEARVCQYEMTPDSHFLIDRHPAFSNVWLVGGGSGHGYKHGPEIGRHVVGRLDGGSRARGQPVRARPRTERRGRDPDRRRRPRRRVGGILTGDMQPDTRPDTGPAAGPQSPPDAATDMRQWMRWQPTGAQRRFSSLVLTPARVTVGIGALMTGIAGLMPWAEGTVPGRTGFEPAFYSGLGGAGDGIMLILLAGGTAFFTLHETPAMSRVRLVHLIPYLLTLFAAFTVINGYRAANLEIEAWERKGGSGAIAPGLWIAAAGVAVMAVGLAALLPGILRWTRHSDDPADLMTVSRRGVAEAIAGFVGHPGRRRRRHRVRVVAHRRARHRPHLAGGGVRRAARRVRGLVARARGRGQPRGTRCGGPWSGLNPCGIPAPETVTGMLQSRRLRRVTAAGFGRAGRRGAGSPPPAEQHAGGGGSRRRRDLVRVARAVGPP